MPETAAHPNFRVIDDFLSEADWTALWSEFQFMELRPVTRSLGAWKLDDGVPLGGNEVVTQRPEPGSTAGETSSDADPEPNPLERVISAVLERPEHYTELVDDSWDHVSARAYVYPQGTGLSWHVDDSELYAGAFIYYAHPYWNAHWGGELLLAETDPDLDAQEGPMPIMGYRFETESYSERLMDMGCGNFIMPKPNRLVLLSGAPHMIARINPAAGASVRASVSGFFLRTRGEADPE